MRETEFRGKRYKHGESGDDWVYGDFYHSTDNSACIDEWRVKARTVGQSSGRTDSHGVKIFEGDIVRGTCSTNPDYMCQGLKLQDKLGKELMGFIEYSNTYCQFFFTTDGITYLDLCTGLTNITVIGNIYDNPELLK